MSRRQTKTNQSVCESSDRSDRPVEVEPAVSGMVSSDLGPSTAVKTWISIWLPFHLIAMGISFTAVVEPSVLHQRLSDLFHPYLRPMHFSADDRPVYLTHGDSDDQPHRLQVAKQPITGVDGSDGADWRAVGPGETGRLAATAGLAVSDRVARWLATAAMLSENDQPSMVADLILPVVVNDPEITAVRIVRYPTDLNEINAGVTVPYLARVLRSGDSVSLVQLKESRLSAQPRFSALESSRGFGIWRHVWLKDDYREQERELLADAPSQEMGSLRPSEDVR